MEIPARMIPALSQPSVLFAVEARRQLDQGRVRQAIETCKRGLARFPEHVAGYVVLAAAYRRLGDPRRADLVLRRGYQRTGLPALNARASSATATQPDNDVEEPLPILEQSGGPVQIPAQEISEPDAIEPEAIEPEAFEPEAIEPEAVEPEAIEAEATEPEAIEPEAIEPEAIEPEAIEPEAIEAEVIEAVATEPEAVEPEAAEVIESEAVEPEAIEPVAVDAIEPEAIEPEASDSMMVEPDSALSSTAVPAQPGTIPDPEPPYAEQTSARSPKVPAQDEHHTPAHLHTAGGRATPWFPRRATGPEQARPSALALHSAKGAHRMRSANLRLIPGLEFAPLRHEEPNGRAPFMGPPLDEALPEWSVRRSPTRNPEDLPLPAYPGSDHPKADQSGAGREDWLPVEPVAPPPIRSDDPTSSSEEADRSPDLEELARRLEGARIKPVGEPSPPQRATFEPPIVSDTLADILVAQGAYSEALKAFQTLARMRPERLAWYEERIADMKKLIAEGGSISRS